MEKKECNVCSKEIPEDKLICSSCQSYFSMLKEPMNSGEINRTEGLLTMQVDRSCEHCGYIFNREFIEMLKLKEKDRLKDRQKEKIEFTEVVCVKLFWCPECGYLSEKIVHRYRPIIHRERKIGSERPFTWDMGKWDIF
ncbi:MAG: hypothetical protein ACFFAK_17950 [Promethearchaeota archaeon]